MCFVAYGSVPKDHIPTDYGVRLQFHIIVPCNEINLSRIAKSKTTQYIPQNIKNANTTATIDSKPTKAYLTAANDGGNLSL